MNDMNRIGILLAVFIFSLVFFLDNSEAQASIRQVFYPQASQQFFRTSSGFEKYVFSDWVKVNDTDYNFTLRIDPILYQNITTCLSNPLPQIISCLKTINQTTFPDGEFLYEFDTNKAAANLVSLASYPLKNLTSGIRILSPSLNMASGSASFVLRFPDGWKDGEELNFGFGTGNISSVTTSELILGKAPVFGTISPALANASASILFVTLRNQLNTPTEGATSCELLNTTHVRCQRDSGTASDTFVRWYVAEFSNGVSVQRGSGQMTATQSTNDSTITAVNLSNTFIIGGGYAMVGGGSFSEDDFIFLNLSSTTNIRAGRHTSGSAANNISWQVVSFSSAYVQRGNTSTLGALVLNETVNLPTAVNRSRSFFTLSWRSSSEATADIGEKMFTGRWLNDSQIEILRTNTGNTGPIIYWEAVELPEGTEVQYGIANFSNLQTAQTATLTSVNLSRSVAFASGSEWGQSGSQTSYAGDDVPGIALFTLNFTNSTFLNITRTPSSSQSATANVTWFVIQFTAVTEAAAGVTTTQLVGQPLLVTNNNPSLPLIRVRLLTNAIGVSNTRTSGQNFTRAFTNALDIAETSPSFAIRLIQSIQSLDLTEIAATFAVRLRQIIQSLDLTEAASSFATRLIQTAQALDLVDAAQRVTGAITTTLIGQALNLTDAVTSSFLRIRLIIQSIDLSEAATRTQSITRLFTNAISLIASGLRITAEAVSGAVVFLAGEVPKQLLPIILEPIKKPMNFVPMIVIGGIVAALYLRREIIKTRVFFPFIDKRMRK